MMSKRLLSSKRYVISFIPVAGYSSKSNRNNYEYYKVVKSNGFDGLSLSLTRMILASCPFTGKQPIKCYVSSSDIMDGRFKSHPNWELLTPKGYRFFLPGSQGPAWHEVGAMVPFEMFPKSPSFSIKSKFNILKCTAQECPVLLRKAVIELFPNSEASCSQQITIVTIKHKRENLNKTRRRKCKFGESELYAKSFIWTAQEICMKLKDSGFWADFINPFSGKPYVSHLHKSTLYEADERFRCIGFEIEENNNCKLIRSHKDKKFIGNLFTNAPANDEFYYDLLK